MRKCISCPWEGKDSRTKGVLYHCPDCGNNTIQLSVDKIEVPKEKPKPKKEKDLSITIPKKRKKAFERIKEYAKDILDDGKRNYSTRKKK